MGNSQDIRKTGDAPAEQPSSRGEIDAFLEDVARAPVKKPEAGRRGRLIFALDATASRQPAWDQACQLQGEMFEAAAHLGGLDIQLVYYRGFRECRAGRWVSDADALHRQMQQVFCVGGHTQIERVLKHTLKENMKDPVQALVFVGDALEENVDSLCHQAGKLGLAGVPAFMFQERRDAVVESAFRQVARLSGGAWAPFDVASAATLRELLQAVAVFASGGRSALEGFAGHTSGAQRLIGQMTQKAS